MLFVFEVRCSDTVVRKDTNKNLETFDVLSPSNSYPVLQLGHPPMDELPKRTKFRHPALHRVRYRFEIAVPIPLVVRFDVMTSLCFGSGGVVCTIRR